MEVLIYPSIPSRKLFTDLSCVCTYVYSEYGEKLESPLTIYKHVSYIFCWELVLDDCKCEFFLSFAVGE